MTTNTRAGYWLCALAALQFACGAFAMEPSNPEWAKPKSAAELAERLRQALELQDTLVVERLIHPEKDDPDRSVLIGVFRSDYACPIEKIEAAPLDAAGFAARAGAAKTRKPSLPIGAVLTITFKEERKRSIKIGDRIVTMGHASSWVGSAEVRPKVTTVYAGESKGVWRVLCFLTEAGKNPMYLLPLAP